MPTVLTARPGHERHADDAGVVEQRVCDPSARVSLVVEEYGCPLGARVIGQQVELDLWVDHATQLDDPSPPPERDRPGRWAVPRRGLGEMPSRRSRRAWPRRFAREPGAEATPSIGRPGAEATPSRFSLLRGTNVEASFGACRRVLGGSPPTTSVLLPRRRVYFPVDFDNGHLRVGGRCCDRLDPQHELILPSVSE